MASNPMNSMRRKFPARLLGTDRKIKMGRRPDFAQDRREAALRRHYDSLKACRADDSKQARIKTIIRHALENLQTTEKEFKKKFA